ncbi:hypothetical protein ACFLYH_02635 [Candidatus Dependentiae bacterium]
MKKINKIMFNIDQKIDDKIKPLCKHLQKYFPIFSTTLFLLLILFFVFRVFYNKPYFRSAIIVKDVKKIVLALDMIDRDCSILGFEGQSNNVDFLNVKKFSGSEVGCLHLAYPKKWRGPYLLDNPTYSGKTYQIIKTKEGYFVVPGEGVKLPNGFQVGKDFKLTHKTDISRMLLNNGKLNYKGRPLGLKLKFIVGDWGEQGLTKEEIDEINASLEEFNAAMPFTLNQTVPYQI